jgi:hypothetical protein
MIKLRKGGIKVLLCAYMKDAIIEDQISTIKRLQAELDERTDFEVKLMNYIIELLKEKEHEA